MLRGPGTVVQRGNALELCAVGLSEGVGCICKREGRTFANNLKDKTLAFCWRWVRGKCCGGRGVGGMGKEGTTLS